jgi:hypothetical protein
VTPPPSADTPQPGTPDQTPSPADGTDATAGTTPPPADSSNTDTTAAATWADTAPGTDNSSYSGPPDSNAAWAQAQTDPQSQQQLNDYLNSLSQTQSYVDQIYQDQQQLNDYYNSLSQTQSYVDQVSQDQQQLNDYLNSIWQNN